MVRTVTGWAQECAHIPLHGRGRVPLRLLYHMKIILIPRGNISKAAGSGLGLKKRNEYERELSGCSFLPMNEGSSGLGGEVMYAGSLGEEVINNTRCKRTWSVDNMGLKKKRDKVTTQQIKRKTSNSFRQLNSTRQPSRRHIGPSLGRSVTPRTKTWSSHEKEGE